MRLFHFNFASSFFERLRRHGVHFNPSRDWFTMLTFSTILLIGIIVWNVWAFDTVAQGGVIGAPTTRTAPVFSRSSLEDIQIIFADRAIEESKYKTGVYRYADPSQ